MNNTKTEPLVILVDEQDNPIGTMPKQQAHVEGVLHRAFSVFIFNEAGELLLQQRAAAKYHSPSLWTNTCCSHPEPGEKIIPAARRRLMQELGFSVALEPVYSFIYKAPFDNGLTEHELDHVLFGQYDGSTLQLNPEEVQAVKWISLSDLETEVHQYPEQYTAWLKLILPELRKKRESGPHVS